MDFRAQRDRRRYPRNFMRHRLANICTNEEDPITSDVWTELAQANLHPSNFISLIQNRTIGILNDSPGERHCYLLESLYRWVTSRYGAINPLTGELIGFHAKTKICIAYYYFLLRKYSLSAEENRQFHLLRLFRRFITTIYIPLQREAVEQVNHLGPEERDEMMHIFRQRLVHYFDDPRFRQLKPGLKIRFSPDGVYY